MVESVFCKNQSCQSVLGIDVGSVAMPATYSLLYIHHYRAGRIRRYLLPHFPIAYIPMHPLLRKHRCALESKISFIGYAELVLTATPFGSHQNDTHWQHVSHRWMQMQHLSRRTLTR